MTAHAQNLLLIESQAACLTALRDHKHRQLEIAINGKLDLKKTHTALRALARLGLAKQGQTKKWHVIGRGKNGRFRIVPDRTRRNYDQPGAAGTRLLRLLNRPMRVNEIAEKLAVTPQRVRQLVAKLHAQGRVAFGDPEKPFWVVMQAGDKTSLLSYEEERVLSVIPEEYTTTATKIRIAARLSGNMVEQILDSLINRRFVAASEGLRGNPEYRITRAGLRHPQCSDCGTKAQRSRLPVESDRIRDVLAAILDAGELRIRDVTAVLGIQHQSINALMQYLKRKQLVAKVRQELHAPYSLTAKGHAALAEMTLRHAA